MRKIFLCLEKDINHSVLQVPPKFCSIHFEIKKLFYLINKFELKIWIPKKVFAMSYHSIPFARYCRFNESSERKANGIVSLPSFLFWRFG